MSSCKTRAALWCLLSLSILTGRGQGWVNFMNTSTTLFSVRDASGIPQNFQGTYYFALLTAPPNSMDPAQFTFAGLYATNLTMAGRFFGGTSVPVPGWAIGTSESFLIAGWSASLGLAWNPAWMDGVFAQSGFFGLSSVGTGIAGGWISTNRPPLPPLNLFGGSTSLPSGFSLYPVAVPEPSVGALTALGSALAVCRHARRRLRTGEWLLGPDRRSNLDVNARPVWARVWPRA